MPHDPSYIPAPHMALAQQVQTDANAPWTNPWAVFWRRKAAIIGVFVLGSVATLLLWRTRPEVYRSSAQLMLIAGSGSGEKVESASSVQARIQSHMAQLKSPLVLNRIVKQVFEASYPDDASVTDAHKRLKLEPQHGLLKMSFQASSPELSQQQLAEIISGYQGYLHYTPQSNHVEAIDQLQREIQQAEHLLAEHQQRRTMMLRPTPFAGTQRDIHEQIDERLQQLREHRQRLQIRKAEIERALASQPPLSTPPADEGLAPVPELGNAAAREFYALELRQRMMSSRARVMRPELQRAADEADQARELYHELGPAVSLLSELKEVDQSLEVLDRELATEQRLAQKWSETATQANQIQHAVHQAEQNLSVLRRQLQRRVLAKELEICQLRIIAPPKPGLPRGLKSTLLYHLFPGIFGSLLIGIVLGCGLEFTDHGFHSPAEIPRTTGAPLVGEVPFLTAKQAAREHSAVGGLVTNYKISHSEFADQFRKIRTALIHRSQQSGGNVLMLASANSGDGQSVCAANLAAAIAQAGKRTLLIDANLRQPGLHETFGVSNRTGLSDILTHSASWQNLVQPTLLADVDLLTSGQPHSSPTELFSSPHWPEFLESIRSSYDYLILDCPAMKESLDLRVLARTADQILVILKVGKTSRRDAQFVLHELGELSQRIVGVVTNNVRNRRRVWCADPWETYQRMHMQQHSLPTLTGINPVPHAGRSLPQKKSAPSAPPNASANSEESELANLSGLLHGLAVDARHLAHSSKEIKPPDRTTLNR